MSSSSPRQPQPQEQQQQHARNRSRSHSLSSSGGGGVISARTEEIQSALEVQIRRLFERFGGVALWGRTNITATTASSDDDSTENRLDAGSSTLATSSSENDIVHPSPRHLRGDKNDANGSKWSQRLCPPFQDLVSLVCTALLAIMNAAVAIFGVGVGVGLILGDSFRGSGTAAAVSSARADDDYHPEGEMEQERRRRHAASSTGVGRFGSDDGGAFGGYIDQPSLSTLPAQ